ncbi:MULTISPECIES: GNAT family N-acetyltransferase [unclassified Pseudomonas]|uniref:GNAT family N-acetyltransferase n=1 Tax=unclassified Pseudomonas TaxID=196821 RepID=UPI00257CF67B|nr:MULTISPECIES: GNAT family N-acetyltransferase [unclassified Pseudomonas]
MDTMILKPTSEADVPFLLDLRGRALVPYEVAAGMQRSEEEHKARIRAHLESGQLVVLENTPIGLIKVVKSDRAWKLLQLQIIPEQQGNGIATTLVTNLLHEARCASIPVVLTVL